MSFEMLHLPAIHIALMESHPADDAEARCYHADVRLLKPRDFWHDPDETVIESAGFSAGSGVPSGAALVRDEVLSIVDEYLVRLLMPTTREKEETPNDG